VAQIIITEKGGLGELGRQGVARSTRGVSMRVMAIESAASALRLRCRQLASRHVSIRAFAAAGCIARRPLSTEKEGRRESQVGRGRRRGRRSDVSPAVQGIVTSVTPERREAASSEAISLRLLSKPSSPIAPQPFATHPHPSPTPTSDLHNPSRSLPPTTVSLTRPSTFTSRHCHGRPRRRRRKAREPGRPRHVDPPAQEEVRFLPERSLASQRSLLGSVPPTDLSYRFASCSPPPAPLPQPEPSDRPGVDRR
jgi:hypothetical protein